VRAERARTGIDGAAVVDPIAILEGVK